MTEKLSRRAALTGLAAFAPATHRTSGAGQLGVKMSHATHFVSTADLPQQADAPGRPSALPSRAKGLNRSRGRELRRRLECSS
jgi:hypothetical protein